MDDIEKLIERLGENTDCWTDKVHGYADLRLEASTALSTLQAEVKRLKSLLGETGQELWSWENQRADRLGRKRMGCGQIGINLLRR